MLKLRLIGGGLLASAASLALCVGVARAADDDFMKMAKDYIAEATAPVTKWDGPTTGPKAQGKKLVVYVSTDQRNGGAQGVGDGAAEAAKAIGWEFRILDGQGSVPGRTSAMAQAIALKADGIILGSPDAVEQAPEIEEAVKAGIKVVGWHSGPGPGKIEANPNVFTNITTDPNEVAKASGLYAGGRLGARRASFYSPTRSTRSPRPRPTRKRRRWRGARVARCWRSRTLRSAISPTACPS